MERSAQGSRLTGGWRQRLPASTSCPSDQQIDYVQSLWDRIAASVERVPLADWQRELLEERLAAHRAAPHEARPWEEVLERLRRRLRQPRYMRELRVGPEAEADAFEAAVWYEAERPGLGGEFSEALAPRAAGSWLRQLAHVRHGRRARSEFDVLRVGT